MPQSEIIICSHCQSLNRVSRERVADRPKCGKCHKELFSGQLLPLTDHNYQTLTAKTTQPVLVLFWAPWCGYCHKTMPELEKIAPQLATDVKLATCNTEENRAVASQFAIKGLPTLVLFRQGKEVARQPGAMTAPQLKQWIRAQL